MRGCFALILVGIAMYARALSSASPSDQALIQTHLNQAAALQSSIDLAKAARKSNEEALRANPRDKTLLAPQSLSGSENCQYQGPLTSNACLQHSSASLFDGAAFRSSRRRTFC